MTSEWMKVMLEEIARKRAEAEQAQLELQRRGALHEGRRALDAPGRADRDGGCADPAEVTLDDPAQG